MPLTLVPDLPVKTDSGWVGCEGRRRKGAVPEAMGVEAASSNVVRCESGLHATP